MPKQEQLVLEGTQRLADVISISRQFLRSVRIDSDLFREDALSGYICQGTARSLLESMAKQLVETNQRAFTWTGPYGGGKSSLALTLCSLVSPDERIRAKAHEVLDLAPDSLVRNAFSTDGQGWLVIPVVGKRTEVKAELAAALAQAKGKKPSGKRGDEVIADLREEAERHPNGVLVVIDELGKLLEATAQDGGDIGFFQDLAEAASRCAGKLVVVGILHQAFEAYASRLGRGARDEWAKVQGRYIDIPLVAGTDEVIELVGKAITLSQPLDLGQAAKVAVRVADAIRARRPGTPETLAQSLLACWPLHPITAALLGPISRRKFGQNERSTFGFLASREPLAFIEHLNGHAVQWEAMYGPSDYWDYLRANLEPAILASPDGHRWAQACEAVERTEAKGSSRHVALSKAIALIELFRSGSGLVADQHVLAVALRGVNDATLAQLLKDLSDWKVLIERKHLGAWGIFAGSDFDIEAAVKTARAEIGEPDLERIARLTDLQPVLAKRLYQETGTMRWFQRALVRLEGVDQSAEAHAHKSGSVGTFMICLPSLETKAKSAEQRVAAASANAHDTLILGTPKNAERIAELSLELVALERISKTHPELHGDSVARRELQGRTEAVRAALEEDLAEAFISCVWYRKGKRLPTKVGTPLTVLASELSQEVFNQTPYVFSELLNREEPSSNSVKARKDLMYRMVHHGGEPRLGYEGYPADAGLYFTLLNDCGIHRLRDESVWGYGLPHDTPRWFPNVMWWRATESFLLKPGQTTTVADLYKFWSAAPYGLRKGVLPVYALAFFLAHRSQLALYVAGAFTPEINETIVDEWLLDPKRLTLKFVEASLSNAALLERLSVAVGKVAMVDVEPSPLNIARTLVSVAVGLPEWSKRTATVSVRAQQVRAMLLKASDPNKVLFSDLPTLLETSDPEELSDTVLGVLHELQAAYGAMLARLRLHLLAALDHMDRPLEELRERAALIKGITGNLRLDAFSGRLETIDESNLTLEGLISLAVSKPPMQWVDRDIDAAISAISNWAVDFRRAEAMAPLRNRPSTRRVLGVVFGARESQDASGYVDLPEKDTPAVDRLVKTFLANTMGERPEVVLAALAEAGALTLNKLNKEVENG